MALLNCNFTIKNALVLGSLLFNSFIAEASWSTSIIYEKSTSNQHDIAESLAFVSVTTLPFLEAQNLASPTKLTVINLSARLSLHLWVNDDTCKLSPRSPNAVRNTELGEATYYFAGKPEEIFHVTTGNNLIGNPCTTIRTENFIKSQRTQ